jgi:hypothetical protein
MYRILKKMSNKLQSYTEACRVIDDPLASEKSNDIRILEPLLSYAEHQFGKKITGKVGFCRREDGDRISNWDVEIGVFKDITAGFLGVYTDNFLLSTGFPTR